MKRHERPVLGPFDLASTVFQRHTREVVLGAAVFVVPAVVFNLVASRFVFARFSDFDQVAVSIPELIGGVEAATGAETLLAFLAVVINSLSVALAGGYLAAFTLRRSLNLDVSVRSVLSATAGRIPALLVAWLVGHSWLVLGSLALVKLSGGDLAVFAVFAAPLGLWLMTLTLLASPVIVIERLGPIAGLRRAARLARRPAGPAWSVVVLGVVIGGGLRVLIGGLPQLLEATGLLTFGRFGPMLEGVASQMSQLVTVPLVGLATAQCYLQWRMDREGIDLVLEADAAFDR